jgi:hypothetical protein
LYILKKIGILHKFIILISEWFYIIRFCASYKLNGWIILLENQQIVCEMLLNLSWEFNPHSRDLWLTTLLVSQKASCEIINRLENFGCTKVSITEVSLLEGKLIIYAQKNIYEKWVWMHNLQISMFYKIPWIAHNKTCCWK